MSLKVYGGVVKCFIEYPSIEICLIFFHDYTGVMGFGEECQRGNMPFSSHHMKGTHY